MRKYLLTNEFVPHAPKNAGTIHINHTGCPAGDDRKQRLYITRKVDGSIVAFCHHCSLAGFQGVSKLGRTSRAVSGTLRALEDELHARGTEEDAALGRKGHTGTETVRFPASASFTPEEWPKEVTDWYQQYGITNEEARRYGFSYIPSGFYHGRLALPCWSGVSLLGYQLRQISGTDGPKYYSVFNRSEDKRKVFDSSKTQAGTAPVPVVAGVPSSTVVIVEDTLSAIKVGRQARAIACLTSTIDHDTLVSLRCEGYNRAVVWLDNDNPDVNRKARTIYNTVSLLFPSTLFVSDKRDPKHYTDIEIGEVLWHGAA